MYGDCIPNSKHTNVVNLCGRLFAVPMDSAYRSYSLMKCRKPDADVFGIALLIFDIKHLQLLGSSSILQVAAFTFFLFLHHRHQLIRIHTYCNLFYQLQSRIIWICHQLLKQHWCSSVHDHDITPLGWMGSIQSLSSLRPSCSNLGHDEILFSHRTK